MRFYAVFAHILRQKPDKDMEVLLAPVLLDFIIFNHSISDDTNLFSLDSISSMIEAPHLKLNRISFTYASKESQIGVLWASASSEMKILAC